MKTSDFNYELPESLIAKRPLSSRAASRLLVLDPVSSERSDRTFTDILEYVQPGDILVLNNTRVIPARLFGVKSTGGKIEILIERLLPNNEILAHIRSSKSPTSGAVLQVVDESIVVLGREGALFHLQFRSDLDFDSWLASYGHMPLPPYIDRPDDKHDLERYQTVFATESGAVAAPTAGLHFDEELLEKIKAKGASVAHVTLHVGAGTFQPVRVDDVKSHEMHKEWVDVPEATVGAIAEAKSKGGRVIAIGTTSVRSLEAASESGDLQPFRGDTQLFIYPGYEFKTVDAMVTNFHLPESTLLMLISAFAGKEFVFDSYAHAIRERYRFFSYGDAMFLSRRKR